MSRQNAFVPGGCSCGTGNQPQLTTVAFVNPVAQDTRIAKPPRQHKVDSQVDLGFPWDPREFTGVQETEVRGDQAVVACSRKTQSMGSCDVQVLPESFTSVKQRTRIRHAKQTYPRFLRGALKISTFRPLGCVLHAWQGRTHGQVTFGKATEAQARQAGNECAVGVWNKRCHRSDRNQRLQCQACGWHHWKRRETAEEVDGARQPRLESTAVQPSRSSAGTSRQP